MASKRRIRRDSRWGTSLSRWLPAGGSGDGAIDGAAVTGEGLVGGTAGRVGAGCGCG